MTDYVTCDLCDEHKNDTDGAFRVLPPVFKDFGRRVKFFGQVSTVKCFEDNTLVKAAVDSPGQGRVLVVDGGASLRRALVGGNLGKSATRNGWAGVLVDGCVRDVAELAECDIGIRALASSRSHRLTGPVMNVVDHGAIGRKAAPAKAWRGYEQLH